MPVNLDKPHKWKTDIAKSVDMYNKWFLHFAPKAFRDTRIEATKDVEATLKSTENLTNIRPEVIKRWPEILPTLRMSTCPPLAVDRLIGLADVPPSMVKRMEKEKKLPVRLKGGVCQVFCVSVIWSMLPERSKDDDDFQRSAGRVAEGLQAA